MMDEKTIRKEVIKFWDATGDHYDEQPFHGVMSKEEETEWMSFFKNIIPPGSEKILEVGGGTGFVALRLASLGYHVKCSDISNGMIARAKRKAKEQGLEDLTEFYICDAQDTGEADNSFDVVINRQMMWMLPNPEKALADWIRVVKPGGKVIIIAGDGSKSDDDEDDKKETGKSSNMSGQKTGMMSKKDKMDEESNEAPQWFSDELLNSLPMVRGDKTPEEFMKRDDAVLEVITLDDIQEAEDKALEKMTGEKRKRSPRKVYILTKEK